MSEWPWQSGGPPCAAWTVRSEGPLTEGLGNDSAWALRAGSRDGAGSSPACGSCPRDGGGGGGVGRVASDL